MKKYTKKPALLLISLISLLFLLFIQESCKKKDKDTTKPEITITGSNPVTTCVGVPYVDAGATATDDKDGDITSQIKVTISVDTSQEGSGTVNYEVSDAAGNKATAVRQVIVMYCK